MSLADHLSSIKVSYTNTFDINSKYKKSLIYEDGSSLSREETYLQCKEGFDNLCVLDKKFKRFENLYLESEIDQPFMLLLENDIKVIQLNIRQFLYLLTDYMEMKCTLQAIEWLIFHYEVHLHQPEDILIACFPLHERPIFIKFIRLFNLKKKEFSWLKTSCDTGHVISSNELSTLCLKNSHLLEMVCGWPSHILEVCNNDAQACKRMFRIIFNLAVHVFEKVNLKGSEKISKHMSPFTRFIWDGINSTISDFISSASVILVYLSDKLELDEEFLRNCIKKMLKSNILQNFTCLSIVIDIVSSQKCFSINEKLGKLIRAKIEKLGENDKKVIEKMLSEVNIEEGEAMDIEDSNIKNEDYQIKMECCETTVNAVQVKDSVMVAKALDNFNIDWTADDIENKLSVLISSNILTWFNSNNAKINSKISHELLKLMKKNSKQLQFPYRHGGLITYLCATLMSPSAEIRRETKRLMTKVAKDCPHINVILNISKETLASDQRSLMFGEIGRTLLSEIDAICVPNLSPTIQKVALHMINAQTITLVPSLTNVWSLFLQGISVRIGNVFLEEAAMSALTSIGESFSTIDIKHQNMILDAITSQLDGDHEILSKVTVTLSKLHLSLENFQYLLQDAIGVNTKSNKKVTKKIVPRRDSKDSRDECIQGSGKYKVLVSLGAINLVSTLCHKDQIQLIHPLFVIIERVLKNNDSNKNDMIYLLTNLMSAMLTILSAVESSLDNDTKDRLIPIINIEEITKCLYIFNDANLHNLILTVIQKLAKLDLGLEQFPLIFFMNWLGKHIVPRDDQHSMNILNSVLELVLPVVIKVRQNPEDASNSNVKIIASFVKDCIDIPKHRALLLYYNLIKNLSEEGFSALWIQLIFMVITKGDSVVQSTIITLMKKFSKEEQLQTIKKVISFLVQFIGNPSKKRSRIQEGATDSPMQKKRKLGSGKEVKAENASICSMNQEQEFQSMKEYLISTEKNVKGADLLKMMVSYFLIHLKESQLEMNDVVPEVMMNLISSLFSSMKVVSNIPGTLLDIVVQNEITVMIREVIEAVGMSLPRIKYMELIVDIVRTDSDESVKLKALELLANKLTTMSTEKNFGRLDDELLSLSCDILSLCVKTLTGDCVTNAWHLSVQCATNLVSIGVFHQDSVKAMFTVIYETLLTSLDHSLANQDQSLSTDKVVLINVFLQKFVSADNDRQLTPVFKAAVKVIDHCVSCTLLANGEVESALSLVHAIVSRGDSETIGWTEFESLSSSLFQLTTVDLSVRKLSRASVLYQKNIRMKLAKSHDTDALLSACVRLIAVGLSSENLTFVSGAISMFGCHLTVLNKRATKWTEQQCDNVWTLVWRMMSVGEDALAWTKDARLCEEIAMKALNQLFVLMDYDQSILTKMFNWSHIEPKSAQIFLTRTDLLYRVLHHVITTCNSSISAKVISFINESNVLPFGAVFLNHLAGDRDSKKKTKKRMAMDAAVATIGWSREDMMRECPNQCREAMESVCQAVYVHLQAEHRASMNLEANDETSALIGALCATLMSMDQYITDSGQYVSTTDRCLVPVITQVAINACSDDSILTPLATDLAKYYTELQSHVHLAVLKTVARIKDELGATFDSSVRAHVDSFLENCKYHEDETIADLAAEI